MEKDTGWRMRILQWVGKSKIKKIKMLHFFKKSLPTFIAMLLISILGMTIFYFLSVQKRILPIYNPADVNPKLVDNSLLGIRKSHMIGNFKLIDQEGNFVTEKTFEGKIYIADFFFTRCVSICPIMTNAMKKIQQEFIENPKIMLLSHSVTPVMDSVPILKKYAKKNGVLYKKWRLVTGDKKQIYHLARKNYFAVLDNGDGGIQDFIHTENFVLVDTKKRIRGFYDGTNPKEIQQLISDIKLLLKSNKNK